MNNYAIIGKGFIFPRHQQAIEATGGKVLMTCDTQWHETRPDFTDWMEMYQSPRFKEVDTVVVCAPNYLHGVMAREALRRGKKVICEKPLCIDGVDETLKGVNTVLQLRYHPNLQGLNPRNIEVVAKMYRDDKYWASWKGDTKKSGGILFNLGIHYIDLFFHLFGEDTYVINRAVVTDKMAEGKVTFGLFGNKVGTFLIKIVDSRDEQERYVNVDGQRVNLSDKDNLSYEDLHVEVYKHFLQGDGIRLSEAEKSIRLVEDILKFDGK